MTHPSDPDHWNELASDLGANVPAEVPDPPAPKDIPKKMIQPPAAENAAPAKPADPAHWGKLAGSLGLDVSAEELAAEEEAARAEAVPPQPVHEEVVVEEVVHEESAARLSYSPPDDEAAADDASPLADDPLSFSGQRSLWDDDDEADAPPRNEPAAVNAEEPDPEPEDDDLFAGFRSDDDHDDRPPRADTSRDVEPPPAAADSRSPFGKTETPPKPDADSLESLFGKPKSDFDPLDLSGDLPPALPGFAFSDDDEAETRPSTPSRAAPPAREHHESRSPSRREPSDRDRERPRREATPEPAARLDADDLAEEKPVEREAGRTGRPSRRRRREFDQPAEEAPEDRAREPERPSPSDEGDDEDRPRRRRRRRRRRPEEDEAVAEEQVNMAPVENDDDDEFGVIVNDTDDDDEEDDDAQPRRRRRRRRGRRRDPDAESSPTRRERTLDVNVEDDDDDLRDESDDDVDQDDDDDDDDLGGLPREKHRKIPTWDEAIGHIVERESGQPLQEPATRRQRRRTAPARRKPPTLNPLAAPGPHRSAGMSPSRLATSRHHSHAAARHNGACPRWAMLLASNDPGVDAATTGHVPVGRCSSPPPGTPPRRGMSPSALLSPATIPPWTPPRRGMSPSSVAPRQQRPRRGRRHDGACPRWAMLLASNDPGVDAATTGHVPVERCLASNDPGVDAATTGLAPVERCSSPATTPAWTPPRRGMSPLGDAPRQQRPRRGRRHDGACPRRALLLAQSTSLSGGEQRRAGGKPSGGGNV